MLELVTVTDPSAQAANYWSPGPASGVPELLFDIWGTSSNAMYAVGAAGRILFNDGAGAFPIVDSYEDAFGSGVPIALDFDGDLDLDLILPGSPIRVLLNDGAGQFTSWAETINSP